MYSEKLYIECFTVNSPGEKDNTFIRITSTPVHWKMLCAKFCWFWKLSQWFWKSRQCIFVMLLYAPPWKTDVVPPPPFTLGCFVPSLSQMTHRLWRRRWPQYYYRDLSCLLMYILKLYESLKWKGGKSVDFFSHHSM